MIIDIRVPEAGESITQVELAQWLAEDGQYVEKDQDIAEIDSDKATLTLTAEEAGVLKIIIEEGSTIEPGKIIGQIDPDGKGEKKASGLQQQQATNKSDAEQPTGKESASAKDQSEDTAQTKEENKAATPNQEENDDTPAPDKIHSEFTFSPQARKWLEEQNMVPENITLNPDHRRITKKDILWAIATRLTGDNTPSNNITTAKDKDQSGWGAEERKTETVKMSTLRKKVAERLVAVKNQTAMLTTFNEIDMSAVLLLREKYKEPFLKKYGVKPGLMSFFAKAVTQSIPFFPQVNGQIDDGTILLPNYADLGIAVSTPKGLMVPVIRDAHKKTLFELEQAIMTLAAKARDNKITIEELTGGTFSITNGGVFGSMLSTPILNPPQSAILGMHNIVERPVAIKGKVEIRPVMYVALSYDHRIVDGKESVGFLVKIKEFLENPVSMLFHGKSPEEVLLGL